MSRRKQYSSLCAATNEQTVICLIFLWLQACQSSSPWPVRTLRDADWCCWNKYKFSITLYGLTSTRTWSFILQLTVVKIVLEIKKVYYILKGTFYFPYSSFYLNINPAYFFWLTVDKTKTFHSEAYYILKTIFEWQKSNQLIKIYLYLGLPVLVIYCTVLD